MSTVEIVVAPEDAPETARKLLEAAGEDFRAIRTGGLGAFFVPQEIAEAAGLGAIEQAVEDTVKTGTAKRGNKAGGDVASES